MPALADVPAPQDCGIAMPPRGRRILRPNTGRGPHADRVEPLVLGRAGMIVHPAGYLKGLRASAEARDAPDSR